MVVELKLSSLVIVIGMSVGLTLALALWLSPWGNRTANRLLSILLGSTSLLTIVHIMANEGVILPKLMTAYSVELTLGPLLYLYTRTLTLNEKFTISRHFWHFLPAIAAASIWWWQVYYVNLNPEIQTDLQLAKCDFCYSSRIGHRLAVYFSVAAYSIAVLRLLGPFLDLLKTRYSSIEHVNLQWLKMISVVFLFLAAAAFAIELRRLTGKHDLNTWAFFAFSPLILSVLIGGLGLLQRQILLTEPAIQRDESDREVDTSNKENKKYKTSSLGELDAQKIWQRLELLMSEQKPYLEAGLKISDLANIMGLSISHLSEAINGQSQQSFYELVNKYRVDEAARLLLSEEHQYLSVTDIGFHAGFNSNSTFFIHFKNHLATTPSKYRKQNTA